MIRSNLSALAACSLAFVLGTAPAAAEVVSFTETFDSNDANWLDANGGTPTHNASGGVGDSGYISFLSPTFNSGVGGFGDPLMLMFRGNASADASGDAFVGDWLADGVTTFSLSLRHNYSSTLNLYTRIAGNGGAGASLANDSLYAIAPNTWTTISYAITDSNPPFTSYGSSSFAGVFANVLNLQIGLYLPANTEFDGLRVDLDNVAVSAVPVPPALGLFGLAAGTLAAWRRRRG